MKTLSLCKNSILFVLLCISPLFAQEFRAWEPMDGIPLRQGHHIEFYRSVARDDLGNAMVVWTDAHTGDRNLYAMLINPDGSEGWDEPLVVNEEPGRQEDPSIIASTDGNWIISWLDFRDDHQYLDKADVYIQKITNDADILWDLAGVELCTNPDHQLFVMTHSDYNGGAITIWTDYRNGSWDLYAQRVNSEGAVQWEQDGIPLASGIGDQGMANPWCYTSISDGTGGIVAAWRDNREPQFRRIYCQKMDVDGSLVWTDEVGGLPLNDHSSHQDDVQLTSDGSGGVFIVWKDRIEDEVYGDLYIQHINADGDFLWEENGSILCAQQNEQRHPRFLEIEPGSALVAWEDYRDNEGNSDLYIQKIYGESSLEWEWGETVDGNVLCTADNDQFYVRLCSDGEGGVIATWEDQRHSTNFSDVYCQRITSDGNRVWGDPNGIPASVEYLWQEMCIPVLLGNGHFGVFWNDYRTGSPGLYYQVMDSDGDIQHVENGLIIEYGISFDVTAPRLIPSADNLFVGWLDTRCIVAQLGFLQKIQSGDGLVFFEEDGINITPEFIFGSADTVQVYMENIEYLPDGAGGILAVWEDNRECFITDIYAQRIDEDGDPLWGDRGVIITPSDQVHERHRPVAYPTGDGGMIIVYSQYNDNWYANLYAQCLDASGNHLWGDDGIGITDGLHDFHCDQLVPFDDGTFLIVYTRIIGGGNERDLFCQRLDSDGNLLWESPVPVCEELGAQKDAVCVKVEGGVIIVWQDHRPLYPDTDIYAQCIHPDGSLRWEDYENGRLLVDDDVMQESVQVDAAPGYSSQDFWITWETMCEDGSSDIFAQRFFADDGAPANEQGPITVSAEQQAEENPQLVVTRQNSVFIVWETTMNGFRSDLRFKHILENGESSGEWYPAAGLPLTQAFHHQVNANLILDPDPNNVGFIAVWEDLRCTGKDFLRDAYAQHVIESETGVHSEPFHPNTMTLNAAYPNPFNPSTNIGFELQATADVQLVIYDLLGREVVQLVDQRMNSGQHSVVWDGCDSNRNLVASGTYFYRLEADGIQLFRSMILLK